jgi:hypothetical protein
LLAWRSFRPGSASALRVYTLASAIIAVLLGALLGFQLMRYQAYPIAILVVPEAKVRQGPIEESKEVFVAYDGAEMRVLDQKDNWLQVSTDPKRFGWVRRDQVTMAAR